MADSAPLSDADFTLAQRAVERGWLTKEQVEAAVMSYDRSKGTRLLAHLLLTPEQIRSLEAKLPPEIADPSKKVGRYILSDLLGKGGMGMVFRAWDLELGRWVALKFLKAVGDEAARACFRREAQLAAGLDHPNIAKIHEVGTHEGEPFIAMQLIQGRTLGGTELSLDRKLDAVLAAAEAVDYAHSCGIIHRDLKPANVMLDTRGQVFVMDFGLAKATNVASLTVTGAVVGTPSYIAPEQARGKPEKRSDVYGLGAILYELTTGRPPFMGTSAAEILTDVVLSDPPWPRALNPDLPRDVEAIILKAMEKEPKRRYPSAGAMVEDLRAFRAGDPLRHARRRTLLYLLQKRIRKHPAVLGLALLPIVTYLWVDGGLPFPVGRELRGRIDGAGLSLLRPCDDIERIDRRARVARDAAIAELDRRLDPETGRAFPAPDKNPDFFAWTDGAVLAALLSRPLTESESAWSKKCLEQLFEKEFQPGEGWWRHPTERVPHFESTAWATLAVVRARDPRARVALDAMCAYFDPACGGWHWRLYQAPANLYGHADPGNEHYVSVYNAVLAAWVLHEAGRRELLDRTARWLIDHYVAEGNGWPGEHMPGTVPTVEDIRDGLSFQAFWVLMRAMPELPEPLRHGLHERLLSTLSRDAKFATSQHKWVVTRFQTAEDEARWQRGDRTVLRQIARVRDNVEFYWVPWAYAAARAHFAACGTRRERVEIRRVLTHLVSLAEREVAESRRSWVFRLHELVHGLSVDR